MTTFFQSYFKRALAGVVALASVLCVNAVPAYPKWQVKTLQDGSSVKVRLSGDEWYHYWETEDGLLVEETPDGAFVKTAKKAPSPAELRPFRKPQTTGKPYLPSRGLVVLVNCSDSIMRPEHTQSVFNDFCNATNCTTNVYNGVNYGSAAQYFADQSNGAYRPTFDVYGPVNLTHPMGYYGEDRGTTIDLYMGDFVIEAVEALEALGCDFSQYDLDQDGYVDFIYFIYAGIAEAYGGGEEAIWPHQHNLATSLMMGKTHGGTDYYYNNKSDYNLPVFDGKTVNLYACSSELSYDSQLAGIGTLCHEFGHVMGLPDFYNTTTGTSGGTPGVWDIMDGGNYNGGMHCPPNYNAWSKAFFGWTSPINLGNENSTDTLYAAGSENYNVFQVNKWGEPQAATDKSVCYYLEHRQQTGWDEFLPSHGLVTWRVDYDRSAWVSNKVNTGYMRMMYSSVGDSAVIDLEGRAIEDVTENDSIVTFSYVVDSTKITNPMDYEPLWTNWAYYDDGEVQNRTGYDDSQTTQWAIMFPELTLPNDTLSKISVYEEVYANTQPITIEVYSGGDEPELSNKIYSETVVPAGVNGFHEIKLQTPVLVNRRHKVWIVLSETGYYPMITSGCSYDNSDKSWMYIYDLGWKNFNDINWGGYAVMIRAYFGSIPDSEQPHEGIEETTVQSSNPQIFKYIKDGKVFIRRGDNIYTPQGQKAY